MTIHEYNITIYVYIGACIEQCSVKFNETHSNRLELILLFSGNII